MSPEEFLIENLRRAKRHADDAMNPELTDDQATTAAYKIASRACIAYLTDQLLRAGMADTVRDWMAMADDGEPAVRWVFDRLQQLDGKDL